MSPHLQKKNDGAPIVIKKYANRRLYDTESSSYVTLDDLAALVREGRDFVVRDAKTGQDLTRQVLTQIIFEQENRGQTLLSEDFLRHLIRFYGDSLAGMLPRYLQSSIETFVSHQEEMRRMIGQRLDPTAMFKLMGEMTEQGMRAFEQTMRLFWDQASRSGGAAGLRSSPEPAPAAPEAPSQRTERSKNTRSRQEEADPARLEALEAQLAAIERQLSDLKKEDGKD